MGWEMKRFLKWLGVSLLVLLVGLGGAYLWMTRDIAATHPALADADLPGMIPVSEFWADTSSEWAYRPSHDGTYIAYSAVRGTGQVIVVETVEDRREKTVLRDVQFYYWNDLDAKLHAYINERLWQIDPENPDRDSWVDITPRGFTNWFIHSRPVNAEERLIVASRDRNPAFADIYTTRQDGGDKTLLLENGGRTLNWVLDENNLPLLRFDRLEDDQIELLVLQDTETDDWQSLIVVEPDQQFWVHEANRANMTAIVTSSRGRDKSAVVVFDLTNGAEEVLAQDDTVDLLEIYNLDARDGVVDLVQSHSETTPLIALSPRGEILKRFIEAEGDRVHVDGMNWAGNGRFVTAALSPDAKGYVHKFFDLETGTSVHLGTESFRERHRDKMAETENVVFTARDGLKIPALLLRPNGVSAPAPLVIEVHGGPAAHVIWEYHHFRQFLVNRGYAVLSVNFRGSTGYGRAFQQAAFRQFGRDMQTDVYDAAAWAISQGIADPDAIAVIGGSYGGYAAGMAATEQDTPFAAAIVEHAVLDVEYQMRNNPFAWGLNEVYMERYFGTLENDEDVAAMRTYSPVSRVADMEIPALLVAGKRDRVVGFEQTEEFLRRARDEGKTVEELIFEDEAHGLSRWQNKLKHSRKVEQFLAQHLGGRDGGWDVFELIAKYID